MQTKPWYQSTTIRIAILVALAGLIPELSTLLVSLGLDVKIVTAVSTFILAVVITVRRVLADVETPPAAIK